MIKQYFGEQTITISYGGKTVSYQVEVQNYVDHIEVVPPTKTTYHYGEELDLTGGSLKQVMASGADGATIALSDSNVQITGYQKNTIGTQTLTVSYKGKQTNFTVEVKDDISSMSLQGSPKTEYEYGDSLELSGLSILITRPSGNQNIDLTNEKVQVTGYDPHIIGNQMITISYDRQVVTTYEIKVTNPIDLVSIENLPKTSYEVGEELDVTGGTILVTRRDGSTNSILITKDMVTGFDSSNTINKQTLTVTIEIEGTDYTVNYDISIVDPIASIVIQDMPKTNYLYGDSLNVTGGTILVTTGSGDTKIIPITNTMVTEENGLPFDSTNLTPRNLKVTYGSKTVTYPIQVSDYIVDVILTPPSKITYNYGETLDVTGGSIEKVMASGTKVAAISLTDSKVEVTGFDNTKIGNQVVYVTYKEGGKSYQKQYGVTVEDPIVSITLDTTNVPLTYHYGENLDLSKAELTVTYLSGNAETVPVTTGMISGYNSHTLGSQLISVSYLGTTNTFNVKVMDYVSNITLVPPKKVEYQFMETLDLTGGTITQVMASGVKGDVISLTSSMVSGFDSTTPGTKIILVTYIKEGKTFQKQFQVVVYNDVTRIEVISPNKTNYQYGENLDLTGAKIKAIREDGTEEFLPIISNMVSGYSKTTPGQQIISVNYTDEKGNIFQGNFVVNVGEDYIKNYEFTSPHKKTYEIGESLDLTGGEITEVYASGKKGNKVQITLDMVSGFESATIGTKKILVTYQDKQYHFQVTVQDGILGITIKNYPNKLEYKKGQDLNVTGGTLQVIKKSGITEVPITRDMVSGFNKDKIGMQVILVTYQGRTTQFVVNVLKPETTPSTGGNSNTNNGGNSNKPTKPNQSTNIEQQVPEENPSNEEQKPDVTPPIGIVDDNQTPTPPSGNVNGSWFGTEILQLILASLISLLTLSIILLLYIRLKKNVKIYIEEGNQRVLVGKARVTKDNSVVDLSKYSDKYQEDNYKVFVTESGTKKLNNRKLEVIVKDKVDIFKVKYHKDGYEYKV